MACLPATAGGCASPRPWQPGPTSPAIGKNSNCSSKAIMPAVDKTLLLVGAVAGFLAVAIGAFGVHGLRARLSPDMLAAFETGVRYQMYHALAIVMVALILGRFDGWMVRTAGRAFPGGIVVFSGSLYLPA